MFSPPPRSRAGGNQHGNPNWNLSIPAAVDYFVNVVIKEAAEEESVQGVFLDGADGDPHPGRPSQTLARLAGAKLER